MSIPDCDETAMVCRRLSKQKTGGECSVIALCDPNVIK